MEERKLFELRFELKEISGIAGGASICIVEIADCKETILGKGQVILSLTEVMANTSMIISLYVNEKTAGQTKISMGTLFGDTLSGKVDRWFKLKSEDYENLKIKILANLTKLDKPKTKTTIPTRRSSKGLKEIKCPYLEKLATGKETNAEPLNDVWKYRESTMGNLIKISLEPDSPGQQETEILELGLNHVEDVSIEALHSMPGPHLKQIVKKLCDEAKHLTIIADRLPEIREEMYKRIDLRRDLEQRSQGEMEVLKEKWMKKHERLLELQESRKATKDLVIDKQDQARKLESELDLLKAQLGDLKRENIVLNAQRIQYEDCKRVLTELEKVNQETQKKKGELQEKIDKSQSDLTEAHSRAVKDNETIRKERDEAKLKIDEASKELKSTNESNEKLRKSIQQIKSKLSDLQDLKNQAKIATQAYQAESTKRDEISQKLDQLTTDLEKQSNEIYQKQQDLIANKRTSVGRVNQFEVNVEKKEQEILDTRKRLLEASSQKISQEQICCVRADLDQLIADLEKMKKVHADSRVTIMRDLEAGSKILFDESSKVFSQAEKLDYMIDSIDKKADEIDDLKSRVGNAKKNNLIYVAIKDDPVDVALCDYLATKDEPVPIKFVRQGGGNYLFGTKKIYIKIESGKLLVRVGGGFTSIDEFLTIYTPVELEKKDSPDASPRFSSVSKSSRDSSPSSLVGRMSITEERSPRK
ncbi:hypothetical protein SteCoe_16594 [Stentor coeruleus]|uniref:GAR domain-containing protein n=1 Tax=Stentor coeruleus TaxID=5963 RepID=A0A1R2C113_9CILI|nr:hypothetical protein SteCoe_16594 [Stentor coeruleus]